MNFSLVAETASAFPAAPLPSLPLLGALSGLGAAVPQTYSSPESSAAKSASAASTDVSVAQSGSNVKGCRGLAWLQGWSLWVGVTEH